MKKIILIAIVIALVFSFAACSTQSEEEVRGEQEAEFSLGEVSGLNYENAFIGIGIDLPSDWVFYNDEQIKELNNMTMDLAGEEYTEMVKQADVFFDMYATQKDGYNNINIVFEKADTIDIIAADLKATYEAVAQTTKTSYENMGYTDFAYEISTVDIGGKTFDCLDITAKIEGIETYARTVCFKCNGYIPSVSATTFGENTLDELFAGMYLI